MTNFVPILIHQNVIFPLQQEELVVNSPVQIELLEYCIAQNKPFGIIISINQQLKDIGVLAHCSAIQKNSTDVAIAKVFTSQIIHFLEQVHQIPNRSFSGAIVSYPQNKPIGNDHIMAEVMELIKVNGVNYLHHKTLEDANSYDIARSVLLKEEEKYEFLTLQNEVQRLEYLRWFLIKMGKLKNFKGFSLS